jgi:hypothetical protein
VAPVPAAKPFGKVEHPILKAMEWRRQLDNDPHLGIRGLARREDEVAPTIIRHLKLLNLAPEIRTYVAGLHDAKAVHFFSQRRLALISGLGRSEQIRQFKGWMEVFEKGKLRRKMAASTPSKMRQSLGRSPAPGHRIGVDGI